MDSGETRGNEERRREMIEKRKRQRELRRQFEEEEHHHLLLLVVQFLQDTAVLLRRHEYPTRFCSKVLQHRYGCSSEVLIWRMR